MTNPYLGKVCACRVADVMPTGAELALDEHRIFLPEENITAPLELNSKVDVFILSDGKGSMIADMRLPRSPLNEPVVLTAKDAIANGAFFNWGISRDLYVPKKWQESPINPGMQYVVVPFVDKTSQRLLGCTKLSRIYSETSQWFRIGQSVSLTVFAQTDLGYKMLIDNTAVGLLFHSDVHISLKIGQTIKGAIKHIREDGKIDLSLTPISAENRHSLELSILEDLQAHDGVSTLTDKSSPEDIFERFKVSKGAYKKALGGLLKQKKIQLDRKIIRLIRH